MSPVLLMTLVILSGCNLAPPDVEICVTLPSYEGFCAFTFSKDERIIPKDEWARMQAGRFSMSADDFAQYQAFIEEACIRYKCKPRPRFPEY